MVRCWAAGLGGCSTIPSREHLVSAGLFESSVITVQGFPWCQNEPKTIGLRRAVAKILCKHHNSLLSPVDEKGGIAAFKIFHEVIRLDEVRRKLKPRHWHVRRYEINGKLLDSTLAIF